MGKFKKVTRFIVNLLGSFFALLLFLVLLLVALDLFGQIRNQRKIPGTHCYLQYNELYMTVNLVYKHFPFGAKEKMLLDENILEVYWNENEDIIAVDFMKDGRITDYYLLLRSAKRGVFSPYEPYTIMRFATERDLRIYLEEKDITFKKENHYIWTRGL